jgi:hypothetical protein
MYKNATDCVEIKRGKMFSVALYMLRQTLCCLAPPCPFSLLFPTFSDVAEAHSYVAATIYGPMLNQRLTISLELAKFIFGDTHTSFHNF